MIIEVASVIVPNIISLIYEWNPISTSVLGERLVIMAFPGVQSVTAFPVVFHLLIELKLTNSELGRLALSCSLISSLVSACFEISYVIVTRKNGLINTGVTILWSLVSALVLHPIMMWVVKRTPPGSKFHPACMPVILGVAFIYMIFFDVMTKCQHLGALVIGLAVPVGTLLGTYLVDSLENITSSFMFPLFAVTSVMRIGDLSVMFISKVFPDRVFLHNIHLGIASYQAFHVLMVVPHLDASG